MKNVANDTTSWADLCARIWPPPSNPPHPRGRDDLVLSVHPRASDWDVYVCMLISRRGQRRRALLLRPIAEISNQGAAPCKTRLWREGGVAGLFWVCRGLLCAMQKNINHFAILLKQKEGQLLKTVHFWRMFEVNPSCEPFFLLRMYAAEITEPYKCVWDKHRALPYIVIVEIRKRCNVA